jgi:hypothetical protein
MADLQISQLPALAEADLAAGDELAVVDGSASETKRITAKALVEKGVALIDAGSIPGSALASLGANTVVTASITDANVTNAKLENSSFSFGGLTISLGSTDSTPALDLTDATNYPASSLTGTITNAQLAGSIANNKLANSSISLGGVSINLGDTNATPTFDLTNATNYPASSLTGTVSNAQLAGSIANSKLVNSSINIGGVTFNLGDSDTSPALDLSDATNYPTSSLSGTITNAQLAGSIQGSKILAASISSTELGANSVTAVELADNSVDTGAVIDSSITDAKISAVSGTKITAGSLPATALNTSNLGTGLAISSNNLVIDNTVAAGTAAKVTFSSVGLVTGSASLAASDLPIADATNVGGVSIPAGSGLSVTATGALSLSNSITATTVSGVSVDSRGLISSITALVSSDIPTATTSNKGGVIVQSGGGISVDASGNITTTTSGVSAGTYQSVVVTSKGIVTSGSSLTDAEIPNISAAKLTSGTIDAARFAANSIGRDKFSDTSTTIFGSVSQSGYPTATYAGEFFFDSVEEDLYIWDSNAWQPVTTLTKGSLKLGGVYNASNSTVSSVTSHGSSVGLTIGQNLPTPSSTTDATYLIVGTGGTPSGIPNGPTGELIPPDYILSVTSSTGSSWVEIDLSTTVSSPTASNVSVISGWGGSSTNVQNALAELSSGKLSLGGGNITGEIKIENSGSFAFEGTANDYETRLTVVDPTSADRTITLPDASGTVVLQGQTGVIDSTMISDGAIMNADINANALISISKLEALTGAQIIIGNSSNEPVAVAVTGDISIDNTGLTAIGAGKIVNSMVSGSAAIAGSKITAASTSAVGTVQLNDSTNSTSTSEAATANALKTAYDLANTANTAAAAAFQTTGGTITGDVTLANAKELRFSEASGDGSNYTAFKAQAQSSDITLTLPADSPTGGYVLKANASTPTTLEWAADSATDNTKMPLAGGTFTNDVTFTGDASNGLWDKSASAFVANLTGNVTGTASIATSITVADESSDTTCFPLFATAATGDLGAKSGSNLTFNSSSGALTATSFVGALTGNVTGNVSGSAATVTGAAQSAITSLGTLTGLTVDGDLQLEGDSNKDVLWDKSDGALEFADDAKLKFGSELEIYSTGAASYIKDTGTGNLNFNVDNLIITSADDTATIAKFKEADACELYFNNALKLSTKSTGVDITGNITSGSLTVDTDTLHVDATNNRVGIGSASPTETLHVYQNATDNVNALFEQGTSNSGNLIQFKQTTTGSVARTAYIGHGGDNTGLLMLQNSAGIYLQTGGSNTALTLDSSQNAWFTKKVGVNQDPTLTTMGATSGTWQLPEVDGSTIGAELRVGDVTNNSVGIIRLASYGSGDDSGGGAIMFTNTRNGSNSFNSDIAAIKGSRESLGKGYLRFFTGNQAANAERMRIDSSGRVFIGTTTEGESGSDDLNIATSGNTGITVRSGTSSNGNLFFSDGTSGLHEYRGYVQYKHSNNTLVLGSNSADALTIDSSQNATFAGHIQFSGTTSSLTNISQPLITRSGSSSGSYPFDGFGHLILQARGDGTNRDIVFATGTNGANKTIFDASGNATFAGTVSDSKGNLRSIPRVVTGGSAYTLVAADAGKCIATSAGVTVPHNVLGTGDAVTIVNNSGSDITITQASSLSMYNTADASSGNRVLAGRGMATVWFSSGAEAYISGAGLS